MKPTLLFALFCGACSATGDTASTTPVEVRVIEAALLQDDSGTQTLTPEQAAAYANFVEPGDQHRELAALAGHWEAKMLIWMEPGTVPLEERFSSHIQMILGGRYMVEDVVGSVMGQEFEGHMSMAYNNATKEYFSTWYDTLGTGWSVSTGTRTSDGALHMTGLVQDFMSPNGRPYRSVMHPAEDHNSFRVEVFSGQPDGSEFKNMELLYQRQLNR